MDAESKHLTDGELEYLASAFEDELADSQRRLNETHTFTDSLIY